MGPRKLIVKNSEFVDTATKTTMDKTEFLQTDCLDLIEHGITNNLLEIKVIECTVLSPDSIVNVVLHRDEWETFLDKIYNSYIEEEKYELCNNIITLKNKLNSGLIF